MDGRDRGGPGPDHLPDHLVSEPTLRIPDTTLLASLAAVFSTVFGWLLRLERRSGKTASRMENHERHCAQRQVDLKDDLREIKAHLQRQDEKADEHRERVNRQLGTIGVKVAVIQTQMKNPPTGETGTYTAVDG